MTKRPDSTDCAGHRLCVCGDRQPCECGGVRAPSPGYNLRRRLRPMFWSEFLLAVEVAVDAFRRALTPRLDEILEEIHTMAGQTQAAAAELVKDLHRLADGYSAKDAVIAAKDAEIGELRAALASADADKEAAVASAVDAQDAAGADAINEADAIVENLSPEPVDSPSADSGDGSAPVENPPAEGGDSSAPVE